MVPIKKLAVSDRFGEYALHFDENQLIFSSYAHPNPRQLCLIRPVWR